MSRTKDGILLVFAKEPTLAPAKTRLAASVGPTRASALAAAFLADTLRHAAAGAALVGARLRILHSPPTPEAARALEARARELGVVCDLCPQAGAPDLGARLAHAFARALEEAPAVVAIGTDSPDLVPDDYASAFRALESAPAVLGPARDGGYWAVGLSGDVALASVFLEPIAWSTDRALVDTHRALERRGLTPALLATRDDVDDAPALAALEARLRQGPGRAPRTAAALALVPDASVDVRDA